MKKTILCLSLVLSCLSLHAQKKPMGEFVDELMAKMTVEEKIGQLNLMPGTDLRLLLRVRQRACMLRIWRW